MQQEGELVDTEPQQPQTETDKEAAPGEESVPEPTDEPAPGETPVNPGQPQPEQPSSPPGGTGPVDPTKDPDW